MPSQWSPRGGGAGGGTRTHKGFRPEMCEISAFTGFATPAPRWLRTPAIPKAKTRHLTRAAARDATIHAHPFESDIRKARGGAESRGTPAGARPGRLTPGLPRCARERLRPGANAHRHPPAIID